MAEEVDGDDVGHASLQARKIALGGRDPDRVVSRRGPEVANDRASVIANLHVVRLTRGAKERLHVVVLEAVDEDGFADRGLAPFLDDLAGDPLEVLPRRVRAREHVDAVLDRDGTGPGQALAYFRTKNRRAAAGSNESRGPTGSLLSRSRAARSLFIAVVCSRQ